MIFRQLLSMRYWLMQLSRVKHDADAIGLKLVRKVSFLLRTVYVFWRFSIDLNRLADNNWVQHILVRLNDFSIATFCCEVYQIWQYWSTHSDKLNDASWLTQLRWGIRSKPRCAKGCIASTFFWVSCWNPIWNSVVIIMW